MQDGPKLQQWPESFGTNELFDSDLTPNLQMEIPVWYNKPKEKLIVEVLGPWGNFYNGTMPRGRPKIYVYAQLLL